MAGSTGVLLPPKGYLEKLRAITKKHGILLIFDEVITGFRVAFGGAQQAFGIDPDLTCLGKIIGGGLPVGAYGGKRLLKKMTFRSVQWIVSAFLVVVAVGLMSGLL